WASLKGEQDGAGKQRRTDPPAASVSGPHATPATLRVTAPVAHGAQSIQRAKPAPKIESPTKPKAPADEVDEFNAWVLMDEAAGPGTPDPADEVAASRPMFGPWPAAQDDEDDGLSFDDAEVKQPAPKAAAKNDPPSKIDERTLPSEPAQAGFALGANSSLERDALDDDESDRLDFSDREPRRER
ncbi:MAG TPA: hypothetical protein VGE52_17730, partial [Pirellulales bacterium]